MVVQDRQRRSITPLLLLLALPLGGATFGAFLPMVICPNCNGPTWEIPEKCFRCKDGRRIRVIDLLRHGNVRTVEWDGMPVSSLSASGFANTKKKRAYALSGIRPGDLMTPKKMEAAIEALMRTGDYIEVDLYVKKDPRADGKVSVEIFVVEKSSALLEDPGSPDD
jgi:outer membrane protein assembly factor BamA